MKTVNGTPFVVPDGSSFNITDIVPQANGAAVPDGSVEMSWYDYDKRGFRFVTWFDDLYSSEDDSELERAGWAEDADNQYPPADEATIEFTAGDWFFLAPNGSVTKPTLTVAGQLFTTDETKTTTSLSMTKGVKMRAANPLPVATKLTDIIAMNGNTFTPDGSVEMSWYDYDKRGFRFVTWFDDLYSSEDDSELERAGWAEDADNQYPPADEATIEFSAGRGFFYAPNGSVADPWIAFPNPFYAD